MVVKFFRGFVRLSESDRRLLMRAAWRVVFTRLGLWFLPLSMVRRLMTKTARPWRLDASPHRIGWAVDSVSRYVPQASCLVRAVAAQTLLLQSGKSSCLSVGVALDADKDFRAHAWVKCEGEIVVGGGETGQYAPLLTLNS